MADPNNVLSFDDKVLISRYSLPRARTLLLTQLLQPSLERTDRQDPHLNCNQQTNQKLCCLFLFGLLLHFLREVSKNISAHYAMYLFTD